MNTLIDKGRRIKITAAAAIVSGQPVLVGSVVGVAATAYAIGDTAVIVLEGQHLLKKANEAWTVGAKVYWDSVASDFTVVSTSNTFAGYAGAAQLAGDAFGAVILRQ